MTSHKKRIWPALAAVLLPAALALLLGGCPQPGGPETAQYTVTFESHGGSGVEAVTAGEGAAVEEPAAPTREGHVFAGWFSSAEGGALYDWPHTLAADVTMHAHWQEETPGPYTITFDSQQGSAVDPVAAAPGTLVPRPGDPAREGYAFQGWRSSAEGGILYAWPHALNADITMYARWRENTAPPPAEHTLAFDSQGGSAVDPVTAVPGTLVARPGDPLREGYAFQGWFSSAEGGALCAWPHALNADITMYARWRDSAQPPPTEYTLTFDSREGSAVDPVRAAAGILVARPGDPLREGYSFQGWFSSAEGGTLCAWPHALNADVTMYAHWQKTHTIVFDSREGSPVDPVTAASGTLVPQPGDPLREGYSFQGWFSSAEGGTEYTWPHTLNADVTIYAHWQETHTLAFDSREGSSVDPITAAAGTLVPKPGDPLREGYSFQGWYDAAGGGTLYAWPHTLNADVTMYAQWRENTAPPPTEHTLAFDSRGGSAVDPVTAAAGTPVARPGDPARTGYAFQGWYDAADGGTLYDWPHALTGDVTMYAHWQKTHTLTFDSHGGSAVQPVSSYEGTAVETPADPARENHTFTGWFSSAEGGTKYPWPHILNTDLTMHAQWRENPRYTLSFDSRGGSAVADITAYAGTAVEKPADPTRANHTFAGWFDAESGGTEYPWPHVMTGNTTMHAHWQENTKYTVSFNSHGGSAVADITAYAGTAVEKPADPTRANYAFAGWFDAESGGTEYSWPYAPAANVTMHARWRENEQGFPAPTGLAATVSGDSVELAWNTVQGAAAYEVWFFQGDGDSSRATYYQDVEDPVFTMGQLSRGILWHFWVKAKKTDGTTSPFSESAQAVLPAKPPDAASIVVSPDNNALIVNWAPADGAAGYLVYTSESFRESSAAIKSSIDNPGVTWTTLSGLTNGTTYYIWIKSKYEGGKLSEFSDRASGVPGEPGIPGAPNFTHYAQLYGGLSSPDRLCLYWDAATNATSYEILYNTANTTAGAKTVSPVYGTYYVLGEKEGETLVRDTIYYIRIRARAGSNTSGDSQVAAVKIGQRISQKFEGTFLSRWPSTGAYAGNRPYYMDGHRVGPISEMADVFPWNVEGRPSPIGPSPGRYQRINAKYPLPGVLHERLGITHLSEVQPSGYVLDPERDQYVLYDGMISPLSSWFLFGVVRAATFFVDPDNLNSMVFCEGQSGSSTSGIFVMYFAGGGETLPGEAYRMALGIDPMSQGSFPDPANIEAAQINIALKTRKLSGVAYPAIRLGWLGDGKGLGGQDPTTPHGDLYNPLLIRPEHIKMSVDPVLAAAGVSLPSGWWTKTSISDPPLDPIIVNAFWNAVGW
jgi:uncharacterized repeat protein (TIGR02543 family)